MCGRAFLPRRQEDFFSLLMAPDRPRACTGVNSKSTDWFTFMREEVEVERGREQPQHQVRREPRLPRDLPFGRYESLLKSFLTILSIRESVTFISFCVFAVKLNWMTQEVRESERNPRENQRTVRLGINARILYLYSTELPKILLGILVNLSPSSYTLRRFASVMLLML